MQITWYVKSILASQPEKLHDIRTERQHEAWYEVNYTKSPQTHGEDDRLWERQRPLLTSAFGRASILNFTAQGTVRHPFSMAEVDE
jgi:hypothetical protein